MSRQIEQSVSVVQIAEVVLVSSRRCKNTHFLIFAARDHRKGLFVDARAFIVRRLESVGRSGNGSHSPTSLFRSRRVNRTRAFPTPVSRRSSRDALRGLSRDS